MSVLIAITSVNEVLQENTFQAATYAKNLADKLEKPLISLLINPKDASLLSKYGVNRTLIVNDPTIDFFNPKKIARIVAEAATQENATHLVFDATNCGKQMAPMVAMLLRAGYVSNVVSLPLSIQPFVVKQKVFSNKAFAHVKINTDVKVISLAKNSFNTAESIDKNVIEKFSPKISETNIISNAVESSSQKVSIDNASVVVSAGRGLKGSENWKIIEDLAYELGAAIACSKPVSDMGWRPHSEHVGQTGKPVASNLYIAIGISGAIQHLAGVNASKIKIVINKDPEAPFFKAADYGMVGDAFKILPELLEEIKLLKK